MTRRERLLACFKHQVPDRVPISIRGVDPWKGVRHPSFQPLVDAALEKTDILAHWGMSGGVFMSATDQVRVTEERRPSRHADYVERVTTCHCPGGTLTGVHYESTVGKPGYWAKYFLETKRDVDILLSVPYVPIRGEVQSFFDRVNELGERGIVIASMSADPMYHVSGLTGSQTFALWSVDERPMLRMLIDVFFERCRDYIEYQIEHGVGPVFGFAGPELCLPPLQSARDFEEFVVDYDSSLTKIVHDHGGYVHCHSHGRLGRFIERFADMGADCLHPVEPPPMGDITLEEAKRRVGDRMCIEGNIQIHDFFTLDPGDMRRLVTERMTAGKPGGNFILAPCATPLMTDVLPERVTDNFLTMIEVGLELGSY